MFEVVDNRELIQKCFKGSECYEAVGIFFLNGGQLFLFFLGMKHETL